MLELLNKGRSPASFWVFSFLERKKWWEACYENQRNCLKSSHVFWEHQVSSHQDSNLIFAGSSKVTWSNCSKDTPLPSSDVIFLASSLCISYPNRNFLPWFTSSHLFFYFFSFSLHVTHQEYNTIYIRAPPDFQPNEGLTLRCNFKHTISICGLMCAFHEFKITYILE